MTTLEQPKCRPLPSLTATSVAAESECAPSDTNIGWDYIVLPLHVHMAMVAYVRTADMYMYSNMSKSILFHAGI